MDDFKIYFLKEMPKYNEYKLTGHPLTKHVYIPEQNIELINKEGKWKLRELNNIPKSAVILDMDKKDYLKLKKIVKKEKF